MAIEKSKSEVAPEGESPQEPVATEPEAGPVQPSTPPVEPIATSTPPVESVETKAAEPEAAPTPVPQQQVVYVDAPVAPKKRSNRALGSVFALVATLLYAAFFAVLGILINFAVSGRFSIAFLSQPTFYFPILFFFIGMVLVVLVVNRGGWWNYIFGSLVVAAIVYFGAAGALLLSEGVLGMTQSEANATYFAALASPSLIIAALLAREVAIWTGAVTARSGRRVKARNVEAREAFEREQAELKATS